MKVKRHVFLYIVSFPWDLIVAWPIVLIVRLLWGKDLKWETPPPYSREKGGGGGPCLTCQMKEGSFPVTPGIFPKGWYFNKKTERPWNGTTLGHGIFYGPSGRHGGWQNWTKTQAHEHIHVEQSEVSMLGSFVVGLIAGIVIFVLGHPVAAVSTFFGIWFTGYLIMGISGWLTAWLRGEEAYRGSAHEESARGQSADLSKR
jgi:hypothetical protein